MSAADRDGIGGNNPPKARKQFSRVCAECGEAFKTPTKDRIFCTDAHKAAFHNRSSKIGRSLVPLAMAWRSGRNVKGKTPEARARRASAAKAFAEMCRILDVAVSDDGRAERMPKLDYLRRRDHAQGILKREETAEFHVQADAKAARAAKKAESAVAAAPPVQP